MPDCFKSVSEIISQEKAFKKVLGFVKDYEIIENFYTFFPELKKIVKPVKIEKNKLFLKVENSVWRNELKLRQEIMISKINKLSNRDTVKTIKFLA